MQVPAQQSKLVFGFAAAGHFLFHVLVALFLTIVLVLETEWRRSYDELIALWTLGALLLGLAAPLAGWLGDRWGNGRVMVVFFLGIGAATLCCGLVEDSDSLMAALAVMGLFGAIYHPVGTAWLVANSAAQGKAIGLLGLAGSLGAAVSALVAGLLTDLISWRVAFVVPGLVTMTIGLALWLLLAQDRIVERREDAQPRPEPDRTAVRRAFAALAVTLSLTTVIYHAVSTLLPKWLEQALSPDLDQGLLALGATVTLVYLLGASSQLLGGHLCDRGSAKTAYVASYALKLAALAAAAALAGWPVLILAVLLIFALDLSAPVEAVLIARFSPTRRRGLAYGIRNGIAIVAAPLGVQLVSQLYSPSSGFDGIFLLLCGLTFFVLLAALALPSDKPRTEGHAVDTSRA